MIENKKALVELGKATIYSGEREVLHFNPGESLPQDIAEVNKSYITF